MRKNDQKYTGPEPINQLVVIGMPLKNRMAHMKQIIAHKTGDPNFGSNIRKLRMNLVDKGQMNRFKKG